jgi:uncharacterized membrane protein YeaQ/YmgE (transglycosylase-associated protein family)
MEQIQSYMPYIVMAFNGLIAGWLAGSILGGGGLLRNLVVGIIGAFVGGALVQHGLLQLPLAVTNFSDSVPYGTQILVSTIGAFIVIVVARFLGGR